MRNSAPLNISFLAINKFGGNGGLEIVLKDVSDGLSCLNVTTYLNLYEPPAIPEFLDQYPRSSVFGFSRTLHPLQKILPKFLAHGLWKLTLNKKLKHYIQQKFVPHNLDAVIVLNIPSNIDRFRPYLEKYRTQYKVPIIAWVHGSIYELNDEFKKTLENIDLYNAIFTVSNGIKAQIKQYYPEANVINIHNPIAPAEYITRNPKKLLFIGRITPEKRIKELLQLLTKLKGDWYFDIYGSTGTKFQDQAFQSFIDSLNFEGNVTFHGWQDNPWDQISEAGLLILNSTNEGFGLVLAEANMRGIACLSSNCPVGPADIIIDDVNGWLFEPNDQARCLEILQEIINGTKILPTQSKIQKSAFRFERTLYLQNFKNQILITKRALNEK